MSTPFFEGTSPLISDIYLTTYIAGEDLLTPGVVVEVTGDWTVKRPTTVNSMKVVGITLTAAKSGSKITVINKGLCRAIAWGTITAGDQVCNAPTSGGNGLGKVVTDNSHKDSTILGVCVQGASSGGTAVIKLW
jgi:hypothetical protein